MTSTLILTQFFRLNSKVFGGKKTRLSTYICKTCKHESNVYTFWNLKFCWNFFDQIVLSIGIMKITTISSFQWCNYLFNQCKLDLVIFFFDTSFSVDQVLIKVGFILDSKKVNKNQKEVAWLSFGQFPKIRNSSESLKSHLVFFVEKLT